MNTRQFTPSPRHPVTLSLLIFAWYGVHVEAHPIGQKQHDRTIVVRLSADAVVVDYRLEVGEFTLVFEDLPAIDDKVELSKLSKPDDFYEAFTRGYAPILADNLIAKLDRKTLQFHLVKRTHQVKDENGVPLGHVRCDFVFRADWQPTPGARHQFDFREGNYETQPGLIKLSLAAIAPVELVQKSQPDKALQEKLLIDLGPGDDARLRVASATFLIPETAAAQPIQKAATPAARALESRPNSATRSLDSLLLESDRGLWILVGLALVLGAFHALTPGHGKTLVAAYLVGERGTTWHALVLGLVTTITHTGVVLAIALGLWLASRNGKITPQMQQNLQTTLGLGCGLAVAGLGFWLLLRRLTGRADHFHFSGHGHHHHHHDSDHGHHHHGAADHFHDEHGHAHPVPPPVGWWGLIVLGMSGGIVPCWDAIVMLLLAVAKNLLWLALPLLLAFSAGLAGVLVLIGILVVHFKRFGESRWEASRLFRALPLVSAAVVTCLGLWLCYDSIPR